MIRVGLRWNHWNSLLHTFSAVAKFVESVELAVFDIMSELLQPVLLELGVSANVKVLVVTGQPTSVFVANNIVINAKLGGKSNGLCIFVGEVNSGTDGLGSWRREFQLVKVGNGKEAVGARSGRDNETVAWKNQGRSDNGSDLHDDVGCFCCCVLVKFVTFDLE